MFDSKYSNCIKFEMLKCLLEVGKKNQSASILDILWYYYKKTPAHFFEMESTFH
jgi:hypothetical protein